MRCPSRTLRFRSIVLSGTLGGRVSSPPSTSDDAGRSPVFVTTRWSVVVSAQDSPSPDADRALELLCRAYWYPLYAHVRRKGYAAADAEDLTQAYFARLLEKRWLGAVDRNRGRFRSFLLSSLTHFLSNEWEKARAQKRGGHVSLVPLDGVAGEERFGLEPADSGSAEREFDRRWALALLDTVLARLGREYEEAGKADAFRVLKSALGGDREALGYARLSAELGISEGAARVAVHRLRQRYRELLREEIAQTVAGPEEVADEMRHLFAALGA